MAFLIGSAMEALIDSILNLLGSIFGSSFFAKCAITFIVAMLPIVELRGAIPIGVGALGLPIPLAAFVSLWGNMLPVPFVILFARRVFAWMRNKSKRLGAFADLLENRAKAKGASLYRKGLIGLMIFVAIPLPGTGAWTGAMIAALLDIRLKAALPTIGAGVLIAGIIVSVITYGFTSFG